MKQESSTMKEFFKGTQEWDFFWLRFLILYYFIISYAKILRFCKKFIFDLTILGEVELFRVVLRLSGTKKNFEDRPNF
jgi:hypothetical protein